MTQHFNQPEHKSNRQAARAAMPPAEVLLWSKLKSRQLLGCKFRRQYGIEAYRLDFYSAELRLGIELDGETHFVGDASTRDRCRQHFIESLGIRVLRFLNDDIYENLEGVWEAIARAAREQMADRAPDLPRGRRAGQRSRSTPRSAEGRRASESERPRRPTPPTPPS